MFDTTTRLEVNVFRGETASVDINQLSGFMIKNRIPVVVTEPSFIEPMVLDRSRFNGQYKIICAIDFFDGKHYALEKIRDLMQVAFLADGFDIMITPNRSDKETLNELRALTEFFRALNSLKEIRWTLGLRRGSRESIKRALSHMKKWPASYIRTDVNLVSPGIELMNHLDYIAFIRKEISTPIKVCGNIDFQSILALRQKAARFDVSVMQARRIVKSAQNTKSPEVSIESTENKCDKCDKCDKCNCGDKVKGKL